MNHRGGKCAAPLTGKNKILLMAQYYVLPLGFSSLAKATFFLCLAT